MNWQKHCWFPQSDLAQLKAELLDQNRAQRVQWTKSSNLSLKPANYMIIWKAFFTQAKASKVLNLDFFCINFLGMLWKEFAKMFFQDRIKNVSWLNSCIMYLKQDKHLIPSYHVQFVSRNNHKWAFIKSMD